MLVEGRSLSSGRTQQVAKDAEIGQPSNSGKYSEAADCLSGYPHHEEAERFGRLMMPLLQNRA
jgi:hypothetical protein